MEEIQILSRQKEADTSCCVRIDSFLRLRLLLGVLATLVHYKDVINSIICYNSSQKASDHKYFGAKKYFRARNSRRRKVFQPICTFYLRNCEIYQVEFPVIPFHSQYFQNTESQISLNRHFKSLKTNAFSKVLYYKLVQRIS